ncbi:PEP-CTERM sorting domain-containing protein [Methyloversatilis sp.]|uniref:PEP-CTERM sorting domain-containing protein n=1 Tax=Methyloversatilis sp. TaxID=2569862 RepID=UPI0027376E88|nr:PEP-CTERM sorting domain-containing protein [Methyloversatilis sp.]MDP2867768.1 PEP-CTERM sorting domain-containing protein [Methyloversatilis sp.]MDP3287211.1 PEP-CTERM sorting domain-containing protein [Methyloversatilis sp.]MDP3455467.1 PEP-CTERM sorting domain-containing protein [Methyloversatilis sp.]MDP3577644.1 PEP-CTERM sorting domain-containing protein [Methyloversatilis sp.]
MTIRKQAVRAAGAVMLGTLLASGPVHAIKIDVAEDVMTSSFFQGANAVRGYAGDNRPVFRVSTGNPFGTVGAETIYLAFDYDFSTFSGPVSAILTVQSTSGGFGADASAGNPFTVSAHGVAANPFTAITDDTNPGGSVSWLNFFNQSILPADVAARSVVSGSGAVTFDVSAIVGDWISGSNAVHVLALTGVNDTSGNEFLHGFLNNTEAPGSAFLTVSAVPEPETHAMLLAGLGLLGLARRRQRAAEAAP